MVGSFGFILRQSHVIIHFLLLLLNSHLEELSKFPRRWCNVFFVLVCCYSNSKFCSLTHTFKSGGMSLTDFALALFVSSIALRTVFVLFFVITFITTSKENIFLTFSSPRPKNFSFHFARRSYVFPRGLSLHFRSERCSLSLQT